MSNPSVDGKAVKLSLPVPPRFALRPPLTFDVLGLTRRILTNPWARRDAVSSSVIRLGQLSINYIADGSSTSSLGMFELTVPPGSNVPPPHSHSNNEECVYVLEGTLRYSVGSETRDLAVGQSMSTPKGVVHAFSNPFAE